MINEQEPIKISYDPAKFGSHRHSDSGDIVVLVCHVTWQDQVIARSCHFMIQEPIKLIYDPVKFDGHKQCAVETGPF